MCTSFAEYCEEISKRFIDASNESRGEPTSFSIKKFLAKYKFVRPIKSKAAGNIKIIINKSTSSLITPLYDLGIRNAILKDFSGIRDREDKGVLFETFVFLRLQSMLTPNMEMKFWRTKDGGEVDFILLKDRKPIPIEVKGQITSGEIPSGLKRFLTRYKVVKQAYVINESYEGQSLFNACKVKFLTFETFAKNFQV